MAVLIVAEHDEKACAPHLYNVVTAAKKLSPEIHILLTGEGAEAAVKEARSIEGVQKVLWVKDACYNHHLPENMSKLLVTFSKDYSVFLAAASVFGKSLMPRVAALLDVPQLSEVMEIQENNVFVRPIYAGNALQVISYDSSIQVMTIRPTAFQSASKTEEMSGVEEIQREILWNKTRFIRQELTKSSRPELATAKIVVAAGRGIQSRENFQLIEQLADTLGAAVGASRAAVDAGFAPNDYQVGQTGKVVAPTLYIAVGISGAIQHVAGMKDSKVIVAINQDEDAPIFHYADYGLVGDLFEIIPRFIEVVKRS